MSPLIDAGVNLTSSQFAGETAAIITEARAHGVKSMLVIGCDLPGSRAALQLAQEFDLYATAGIHPHDAKSAADGFESELAELAKHSQVVAIGECGLDYNRDFSPRPVQRDVFSRQLALAARLGKPVYLHERDAHEDQLALLQEYQVQGVLHCFTGDQKALENYLDLGLYIGITGWVCDERRGDALQRLIPLIPEDRLLLETDAPSLLPRTISPKPKSRRNTPANLRYVAEQVAALRQTDVAKLAAASTSNFRRLFGVTSSC